MVLGSENDEGKPFQHLFAEATVKLHTDSLLGEYVHPFGRQPALGTSVVRCSGENGWVYGQVCPVRPEKNPRQLLRLVSMYPFEAPPSSLQHWQACEEDPSYDT